ncbi:MAG: cell division protein FtsA [Candidatus Terrybacteria bacterium]|nr:cell division protein FtsA [Candidatus Terrybacteria bacterium]
MGREIITAVDAGSSMVRIITAEQKKDGELNILGIGQKPSDGIRRGYVVNMEDAARCIGNALKSSEKMAGVSIKKVIISIGGISLGSIKSKGSVMISRADGEIIDYDIKRAIDQSEANLPNISNKHIIHTIPLSFKIDNNLVLGRPLGMKGVKLEVETLFITCLSQHLADIIKTVESAGVEVEDVIAMPLAMSYAVLTKYQKEAGCVLANIGASTISIAVFEEGLPVSLEVFPFGSTSITNDIALGLQIPIDEAERVKIDYGIDKTLPSSKRKLSDIIEARLNDIFELIESHLKKINRQGMLPGGIILTGGGSNLFSLEEIAKMLLHLPAKIGTLSLKNNHSLKNITVLPANIKEQIFNDPGWSVALGLCIMNLDENSSDLPIQETSRSKRKIRQTIGRWFRTLLP